MSDTSDDEGRRLFDQQARRYGSEQGSNDSPRQKRNSKSKKHSKTKKEKKSKKSKKSKQKIEEEEDEMQEEEQDFPRRRKIDPDIADFIESEAEQDDLTEEASDYEREIDAEEEKRYYEDLYGVKKKRTTQKYLQKFENKNEHQINKFYQRKAREVEQNEPTTMRTASDPSVFMVGCTKGCQEQMVMCILNKAKYCASNPGKYICKIISAFASKKKHPGKIFVEAQNDKDVKNSLEGFTNININSVKEVQYETYCSIFEVEVTRKSIYQPGEFVRVRKGLYADDLARVHRVYKHKIDLILVPRINLRLIQDKIKDIEKNVPENIQILRKNEVFKKYTSTKVHFSDPKSRPPKQNLSIQSFQEFASLPHNKKVTLTQQGLIILGFYLFQVSKPDGTILPIELQPFSKTGNLLQQFQTSAEGGVRIVVKSNFIPGETVIVAVGELKGMFGKVLESDPEKVLFRGQNPEIKGIKLIEMPEHLQKKFVEGQKVVVIGGNSKGVHGSIIRQEGGTVVIWTDNNNELIVSKLDVESKNISTVQFQNPLGLRRDDLIKITNGSIGLVLSTSKDSIKIINTTNMISVINNIDFCQKIPSYHTQTRNRNGQIIRREANVKIANGLRKGVTCMVKRVYQQCAFLFNTDFRNTLGYCVEQADNCVLVTQRLDGRERNSRVRQKAEAEDQFKVGMPILLKAGPLKGYRAVVKSITKDQIEISIPQKNLTEWMPRSSLSQLDRAPSVAQTFTGHRRSPSSQRSHSGSPPHRKNQIQQGPQMTGVYRPSTNNSPTYA